MRLFNLLVLVLSTSVFASNLGYIDFDYLVEVEPQITKYFYNNSNWNDLVKEEVYLGTVDMQECKPQGGVVFSFEGVATLGLPVLNLGDFNMGGATDCVVVKLQNSTAGVCYNFALSFVSKGYNWFEFDGDIAKVSKC